MQNSTDFTNHDTVWIPKRQASKAPFDYQPLGKKVQETNVPWKWFTSNYGEIFR